MNHKHDAMTQPDPAGAPGNECLIQVLSLEYQSLRDEMQTRTSGRFQFVGLMTTAAALLLVGVGGSDRLGTWLSIILAGGVFLMGLVAFWILGIHIVNISSRVAQIEARINSLLPPLPDGQRALSWVSDHQQRPLLVRLVLGEFLRRWVPK